MTPDDYLPIAQAARLRGCSHTLIRRRVADGTVASRVVSSPHWRGSRREVRYGDVMAMPVYPTGHSPRKSGGRYSGPATDASWAKLCVAWDRVVVEAMRAKIEAVVS